MNTIILLAILAVSVVIGGVCEILLQITEPPFYWLFGVITGIIFGVIMATGAVQ